MNETTEQLMQRMLKKHLFVMLRRTVKPEQSPLYFQAHLEWMIDAEKRAQIFGSGPFIAHEVAPGTPGSPAGSMTILRAASRDEAIRIAESDPYVTSGTIAYEMKEWMVMEGTFALRINFSDGTYHID